MTWESRMKWTKIIIEWQPRDGKRKRGRQTRRWTDDIKMIGGTIWSRKASNREEWKQLEEAYMSQDTLNRETRCNRFKLKRFATSVRIWDFTGQARPFSRCSQANHNVVEQEAFDRQLIHP
ncbi:hypothetical protein EVAR_9523_1 [Eumeta japonica]|uniref:Uncharacterized protein n=1 Tax=Eumeta variegata TaxID=151549 RepID=A0A4C1U3Q3_EUMVA|nr:hypothetical protein EVAR_9523_1 [Eumeta japonica]